MTGAKNSFDGAISLAGRQHAFNPAADLRQLRFVRGQRDMIEKPAWLVPQDFLKPVDQTCGNQRKNPERPASIKKKIPMLTATDLHGKNFARLGC